MMGFIAGVFVGVVFAAPLTWLATYLINRGKSAIEKNV